MSKRNQPPASQVLNPPFNPRKLNTIRRSLSESLESFCLRRGVKCNCDRPGLDVPVRSFWSHRTQCAWTAARAQWNGWARDRLDLRYVGDLAE